VQRNLTQLASEEYDILIVGAGIYGACAAWDAALRGLRVAIVDKGDFGSATSQNSLKIIHGGLRYLQQADIIRMRESIRERRILMKIAPQFVHPLPCIMPTYGHFTKGREALFVGLLINDIIGFDRNRLEDPEKHLPRGRVISKNKIVELLPGISQKGLTGGAIWHDCQTHNSERLLLSFLLAAADEGARAANYVEATGFLTRGRRVVGITALDRLSGEKFELRARVVINTTGPWVRALLGHLKTMPNSPPLRLSSAINLVTRSFIGDYAAGISGRADLIEEDAFVRRGSRLYFTAPWRDVSLVGTAHTVYEGDPDSYRVTETEVTDLIAEINRAYPSAKLTRGDVKAVHGGLLPMDGVSRRTGEVILSKHYRLIDHRTDGWDGLISVLGVKYTTARDVAEKAVDIALRKLGAAFIRSRSAGVPIYGGCIPRFNDFLAAAVRSRPEGISPESMTHLVYHYGSRYPDILAHIQREPALAGPLTGQRYVTGAEVVHAVREEMALTLSDCVLRRTELGSAGDPGEACLTACADLMAREMGWDTERREKEIREVKAVYIPRG
jgi:glycerol-3-phosphate dehydrogenase